MGLNGAAISQNWGVEVSTSELLGAFWDSHYERTYMPPALGRFISVTVRFVVKQYAVYRYMDPLAVSR